MVEIGEDREIPAIPLERLQRRRQRVIRARRGWEKALLINTVIVRQTNKPLHRPGTLGGLLRRTQCRHRLKQRQRNAPPAPFKKFRLLTFIKATIRLAKRTKSKNGREILPPSTFRRMVTLVNFQIENKSSETVENIEF